MITLLTAPLALMLTVALHNQSDNRTVSPGEYEKRAAPFEFQLTNRLLDQTSTSKEDIQNSDWYSAAIENIAQEEYNITYSEEAGAYQSPNRNNNLRFFYSEEGFKVETRNTVVKNAPADNLLSSSVKAKGNLPDWKVDFKVQGASKSHRVENPFSGAIAGINSNSMVVEDARLKVIYTNLNAGMRQDFIVKNKPNGEESLRLFLKVSTDLKTVIVDNGLEFRQEKETDALLRYDGLQVWDAVGTPLEAHFEGSGSSYAIVVNDADAVYPVTIDPLSNTADNTINGPNAYEEFGTCASFAGDVNNDGYGDIIVGAPRYDGTYTDEGKAFVYYGSSSGVIYTNKTELLGTTTSRAGALFGSSVASAGDVNADGYSDIIVGAYGHGATGYNGRAYVFLGSSSGIATTATWIQEADYPSDGIGFSVGGAGDVNGDGYSDIIIGAPSYHFLEGAAFVFHGTSTGVSSTYAWRAVGGQAEFGVAVAGAGDVNGDGYSDVIVGQSQRQSSHGKIYVWLGSSSGITGTYSTPAWSFTGNSNDFIGISVSTAGDVNGDGYSDIIAGGHELVDPDGGIVYLFYGTSGTMSSTPDWTADGAQNGDFYGRRVNTAGDVNGDGYADIIIGSPGYDNSPNTEGGSAYVFLGSASGMGSSGTRANADWINEPAGSGIETGWGAGCAGDVNGDGFSDVIVGSPYQLNNGQVDIYYGSAGTLTTTANWTNESNLTGNCYFGYSVASAGDVNGDGYSDAIVGAYGYDGGQTDEGRAYVFYGSSTGFPSTPSWTVESNSAYAYFGYSVSSAGSVNGDGYSDVIVGAPYYGSGEFNEGGAFVYMGGSSGLGSTPASTLQSNQEEALFGHCVSAAGDVNRDGYSDVIIGAPYYDATYGDEGKAYVYYGTCNGLSSSSGWSDVGGQQSELFGYSVAYSGCVTNNDYGGILVGAPNYSNGQAMEGRIYYYNGQSGGVYATPSWDGESDQAYAYLGTSVAGLGDVNGDNYADIAAGAPYFDNGQSNEGKVFVWYGSSYGTNLGVDGTGANVDWSAESNSASSLFGYCVTSAGDVNGDGFADVIASAPWYSNGNSAEGSVFLWKGGAAGINGGTNGNPANTSWSAEGGQDAAHFGISVASLGDMNGDAYGDVIVGAYKYDNGQTDEGRAYVYYGNEGACVRVLPRQFRTNLSTNVVTALLSGSSSGIGLGFTARSYQGRMDVKVHRVVTETNLSQTATNSSSSWLDVSSASGYYYGATVTGLSNNRMYRWKVRMEYNLAQNPVQKYSRWYTLSYNSIHEGDIATGTYGECDGDRHAAPLNPTDAVVVSVYPNPANETLNMSINLNDGADVTVLAYDMSGKVIVNENHDMAAGQNTLQYNVSEWSNGIYFFQVTTGDVTNTVRVVIAK